jgi:signal transduction histidine kinase
VLFAKRVSGVNGILEPVTVQERPRPGKQVGAPLTRVLKRRIDYGVSHGKMRNMQLAHERLSIRAAVFLGFGLILALWLVAWVQLSLRVADARKGATAINARYLKGQETLSNIRTQVLIASVSFRDALLDPDRGNIDRYRGQLERTYTALDQLLNAYEPVSNSTKEREQFARLRAEVDAYRGTMLDLLGSNRSEWLAEARSLLNQRVTPRRDIVIAVSEGVQALNRAGYVEQQSEIAGVYRSVQRAVWQLLGLALAIGVAVAVLAVIYAGRLEQRLRRQLARDVELAHELQELSAKVVTAQEQERRQIARELHDEIGQALTAIKVELAVAQRSIEGVTGPTSILHAARSITDGALHQVRNLSCLLHPAALDQFGLVSAVDAHIKSFRGRYEIAAELVHEGGIGRLGSDLEVAAYRIIQEALTNVARHANATECTVRLMRTPEVLRIGIEDNGVGFDPAVSRTDRRGIGLIGIRERAARLNGTALIESRSGAGTRISVELPARRASDNADADDVADATALAG